MEDNFLFYNLADGRNLKNFSFISDVNGLRMFLKSIKSNIVL